MIHPLEVSPGKLQSDSVSKTADSILKELNNFIQVSDQNRVESVHQVRKKLKLFRAFLKLSKPCSNVDLYARANVSLRDKGRLFSDLRDSHVREIMLNEFYHNPVYLSSQSSIRTLIDKNKVDQKQLEKDLISDQNVFRKLKNQLESDSELSVYINSVNATSNCLYKGLSTTYQKTHQTYYNAYLHSSPENMHEWRKRLKDLQYQLELLFTNIPVFLQETYHDVVEINDLLGRDQDVNNLITWLDEQSDLLTTEKLDNLNEIFMKIRHKLSACINHLGKTIFKFEPEGFKQSLLNELNNG